MLYNKILSRITVYSLLGVLGLSLPVAHAKSFFKDIDMGHSALRAGLIQGILAKEICSCVFVSKLNFVGQEFKSEKEVNQTRAQICLSRANLPLSQTLLDLLVSDKVISGDEIGFQVRAQPLGNLLALSVDDKLRARAVYEGEKKGCRLIYQDN